MIVDAPSDYRALLAPLPDDVRFVERPSSDVRLAHVFVRSLDALRAHLDALPPQLPADAMLWISWPKKASKVPTDITEDRIREVALPLGLVDVKVCAIDATWSGLKLVRRKALR